MKRRRKTGTNVSQSLIFARGKTMKTVGVWLHRKGTQVSETRLTLAAFALACVMLFGWTVPAWSYWLPWATEENKISRRLNEIWDALIAKDRTKLKYYVIGAGAKNFIEQEMDVIKQLGIKSIECRVTNLRLANHEWAFVEFEKTDTLVKGGELKNRYMRAMRKIDNDWRLITNIRKRDRPGQRFERLHKNQQNQVTATVKNRKGSTGGTRTTSQVVPMLGSGGEGNEPIGR